MSQWISSTSALPEIYTDCDVLFLSRAIFLDAVGDETAWLTDQTHDVAIYWRPHEEDSEVV